ncbi:hypothetical protein KDA14_05625 [Candidatus Saccharibacteria bacterium]|nr:hypothetical protein [Candidatus Saccharibacteria bacterium]
MEATTPDIVFGANSGDDTDDSDSDVFSFNSDASTDSDEDCDAGSSPPCRPAALESALIHIMLNRMPEDDPGIGRYRIARRPGVVGSCPQNRVASRQHATATHLLDRR